MKKQFISESRLREIISEETLRMKKRITLEGEKKSLIKKLNEMYMEEEMELEEGLFIKSPEEKKAEAEKIYQINYKRSEVKEAERAGLDVPTYKAKIIDFLISNNLKAAVVMFDAASGKMIIPTPEKERESLYNRFYKKNEEEKAQAAGIDVATYRKAIIDYMESVNNKIAGVTIVYDPTAKKMVPATPEQEREMIYARLFKPTEDKNAQEAGIDVGTYRKAILDYMQSSGNRPGKMKWDSEKKKMVSTGEGTWAPAVY